ASSHAARRNPAPGDQPRDIGSGTPSLGPVEIPEELAGSIQYQKVAFRTERALVGVEAAVEGVEVRILLEDPRIAFRRLGVAAAADLLGVPVGLGQYDRPLTVGFRPDLFRHLRALGAQLGSNPRALLAHSRIDRFADLVGELGALHAHVHDLDAQFLRA